MKSEHHGSSLSNADSEDFLERTGANDLIVVGIGASAGGVQALKEFFQHVPQQTGIAYVVILHLSPDFDSKLTEVLQVVAKIPVSQVTSKVRIEPDRVYVVPPNQHLTMLEGEIAVSPNTAIEDRRAPVDIFFRTLADVYGPRGVAVILSGTGANGSMGMKRVKEFGGAALVQNPREAEFNEMVRNAIATGLVDEVLPVSQIPGRIMTYKERMSKAFVPVEIEQRLKHQKQDLREVLTQLRIQTGHDFTNYKRPTLHRRIERRINVRNVPDLGAYAALLRENPAETTALLKDLLISVTNFFRDKDAFEVIGREVLPVLLKTKTSGDQLRIWVAGCATGEEAYSLAMLCAEKTANIIDAPRIQIFATDIDEAAIAHARDALYSINDAADISPERLRRFFDKEGDMYRIRREVREMVLFANHNLVKDPAFSNIDLVSCRNLLIYLNRSAQERVMETFHFSLNAGGILFLGLAETADAGNDLYDVFNREHHIFRKRPVAARRLYPVPETVPAFRFEQSVKIPVRNETILSGDVHQRLLEQYAPPSIVVDQNYEIVHVSDSAGRYLQIRGGEPSQNLLKLVREELRLELRSALYQAAQLNAPVQVTGKLSLGNGTETIKMHVRPALEKKEQTRGYILVVFEAVSDAQMSEVVVLSHKPIAHQLDEELQHLKAQLRTSNQQHEYNTEELKASNEELQAMNEELRSSAEELETSKEELQSINEELRTVNQELKVNVEETTLVNNNLQNLINSVEIGTIFLDRSLRVAFFTPRSCDLFNLIPSDYGRPLSDITSRFEYGNLIKDIETVLDNLVPVEREVRTAEGRVYMMRALPYRTAEDRINGVVLTFIDLTARKKVEEELRASEERLRLLIESAKDFAIFTLDGERHVNGWNTGAQTMMGYSEQEIIGQLGDILFVPEDRVANAPEKEVKRALEHGVAENERWHLRKDGRRFYGSGTVRPLYDSRGNFLGFVKIMRDLTESKQAEDALRESEERFRAIVSQSTTGIFQADLEGKLTLVNKKLANITGYSEAELTARFIWEVTHEKDIVRNKELFRKLKDNGEAYTVEKRFMHKSGPVIWVSESVSAIRNEAGEPQSAVGVIFDITERKQLEQQKDEFISTASHELKTPVTSIKAYTEILQEKFSRSGQMENSLLMQKLNNQVDRLVHLIRDLLDTTRIAEGKLQLEIETQDLNELIAEKIEELQRISTKHTIDFVPAKLKPLAFDRERVGQVITNLVSNAIKYSPNAERVKVVTEAVDGNAKVSVIDWGLGIPKQEQERIFQRFYRIDSPKSEALPGIGLGLYISASIIRMHGGTISVKSEPGKGSVFSFTLPEDTLKTANQIS